MPTGGGKTRLFVEIIKSAIAKGGAALVIAHREELLVQAQLAIIAEGLTDVGIIAPWARRQHARVQVASIQTLAAQLKKGRDLPPADVVVLDEAHHFSKGAPGWYEVAATYQEATIVGVTATPQRGDGTPMGDMFDVLIPACSVRELQELGVLVPCVTYRPDHKTKALCREPLQAYQEHGNGELAFVFCATVAHAEMVCGTFREAGIPAATIHAETPWALRTARVEAFKTQDATPLRRAGTAELPARVLCNVYTLTEGVDVPPASVCILARGAGCESIMLQCVGRVLRASPGKERAIFWDLRGVTHKLLLPEAPREYSLDGKAISGKSEKDDPPRRCKACQGEFMTWATTSDGIRICPLCGERAPDMQAPEVVEREVFAAGTGATTKAQKDALERFAIEALDGPRVRKPGWVWHRFKDAFQIEIDWSDVDAAMVRARKLLGIRPDPIEIGEERARLEQIAASKGIPMSWVKKKLAEKYGDAA